MLKSTKVCVYSAKEYVTLKGRVLKKMEKSCDLSAEHTYAVHSFYLKL